jgi:hypothetical protein
VCIHSLKKLAQEGCQGKRPCERSERVLIEQVGLALWTEAMMLQGRVFFRWSDADGTRRSERQVPATTIHQDCQHCVVDVIRRVIRRDRIAIWVFRKNQECCCWHRVPIRDASVVADLRRLRTSRPAWLPAHWPKLKPTEAARTIEWLSNHFCSQSCSIETNHYSWPSPAESGSSPRLRVANTLASDRTIGEFRAS